MSGHTKGVHVAFTERVTESVRGFEVCTVSETDKDHHPKLLAVARKYEDARLYAAAPDLLAALMRVVDESDIDWHAENEDCPGDDTCACSLPAAVNAAIAKAKGETGDAR